MKNSRPTLNLIISLFVVLCTHFVYSCNGAINSLGPKAEGKFTHGIASGDPDQNSVVLWTRYVPNNNSLVRIRYEVALDDKFTSLVTHGTSKASAENDFCIKVIADGLEPGSTYYYRFTDGTIHSQTGRTRTLPRQTDHIKIGVVNCAKYTGGYYHAYDELAKMDDVDVVIHLGDYIYESGATTPKDSYYAAYQKTGRQHDPQHQCITLEDYRTRYAQYRADTSLQKLHANFPMIPIWDDHEIAMKQGKPDKKELVEAWQKRKDNSIIAYHEWLPLRPDAFENIYRSFQFGDLVNLMMLDTRVCCRSKVTKTEASLMDTTRHIIGNKQLYWIFDEVEKHQSAWNVFGNQILLAKKNRGWARWQGYPRDRDRLLQFIEKHEDKNFVVTTGNAHNPHHYIIFNETKTDTLLHEFLPGSISSGNNSEKARYNQTIIDKEDKRLREAENVLWFHQDSHGFIVLDIKKDRLKALWYFVSTIRETQYELIQPYTVTLPSNSK